MSIINFLKESLTLEENEEKRKKKVRYKNTHKPKYKECNLTDKVQWDIYGTPFCFDPSKGERYTTCPKTKKGQVLKKNQVIQQDPKTGDCKAVASPVSKQTEKVVNELAHSLFDTSGILELINEDCNPLEAGLLSQMREQVIGDINLAMNRIRISTIYNFKQ